MWFVLSWWHIQYWSYWMSALIIQTPILIYHFQMSVLGHSHHFQAPKKRRRKNRRTSRSLIQISANLWYKFFISFFRPAVLCYLCMLLLSLPPFYLGIPCLTYCFCCPCCRVDPLTRFNLWAASAMEGGIWYTNMVLEHKKNVAAHSTNHRQGTAGDTTQKNKSRGKKAPVIEV